jgi:hypothetical protein
VAPWRRAAGRRTRRLAAPWWWGRTDRPLPLNTRRSTRQQGSRDGSAASAGGRPIVVRIVIGTTTSAEAVDVAADGESSRTSRRSRHSQPPRRSSPGRGRSLPQSLAPGGRLAQTNRGRWPPGRLRT